MTARGPWMLFTAWALHDLEEAVMFPRTGDLLADRTGINSLRLSSRQSWTAVGLMAPLIAYASIRGARTNGRSRVYRAVVAGLGAHVGTHIGVSMLLGRYTAGVATALPVMLPGAMVASGELARAGEPLRVRDRILGAAILLPAALMSHVIVRALPLLRTRS